MENLGYPMISVIIPIFNDAEHLKICLSALHHQTYPQDAYEIIVVDNASDNSETIQALVSDFTIAVYAYEVQPGSYAARNRGLEMANGEVIAFTDADCQPALDWLEQGVRVIQQHPNCGFVAGAVNIFFKHPQQPTSVELYEYLTAFPQQRLIEQYHGAATANLFTLKTVVDNVGPFDASLMARGDLEWGKRVFEQGYLQLYAEHVQVAHPARYSFQQLYWRTIRLAAGEYILKCRQCASTWQHHQAFVSSLLANLTPPLRFVSNIVRDQRLSSWEQRVRVSLVMFFVRYVSAWEVLRLKLGGKASR
jgi:glycosyltransferase involved in cell wall biosynthesis